MEHAEFTYQCTCSAPGCSQAALYKVATPWSYGSIKELKSYGLACEAHRDSQLARGQLHRQGVTVAEDETVGTVGLYQFTPGQHDTQLRRLPDHA